MLINWVKLQAVKQTTYADHAVDPSPPRKFWQDLLRRPSILIYLKHINAILY